VSQFILWFFSNWGTWNRRRRKIGRRWRRRRLFWRRRRLFVISQILQEDGSKVFPAISPRSSALAVTPFSTNP
jgi:hypothetical protein